MPSPFPGMDPYLESDPFCDDLRSTLVVFAHGMLNKILPRGYSAWIDRRENTHVMIRQVRSIVTLIEFLSPALKTHGPDRDGYLAKRNEYLATRTNLVEIDCTARVGACRSRRARTTTCRFAGPSISRRRVSGRSRYVKHCQTFPFRSIPRMGR